MTFLEPALLMPTTDLTERVVRFAFDSAPENISISRFADGTYIDVNRGFQRFSGYSRLEMLGRTSVELGIWRSASERELFMDAIVQGSACHGFQCRLWTRAGEAREVEMAATLTRLEGEPVIVTFVMDVTDRVAANLGGHRKHADDLLLERAH